MNMQTIGIHNQHDFMTPEGVAQYLHIKKSTVYSWAKSGQIPHYRMGRLLRFKPAEIDCWLETKCLQGSKEPQKIIHRKAPRKNKVDVNRIIRKAIDDTHGINYTGSHRESDRIKDPGKEVDNGSF